MDLTIERFDLDPSVREPNTPRETLGDAPFPTDFPFIVDDDTQQVVEPLALFLSNKFNSNSCFKRGTWTKRESAQAAAADLKVWWEFLNEQCLGQWDDVSDRVLAAYLKVLQRSPSAKTGRHLEPITIKRHCASIDGFNNFARVKWPAGNFPSMDAAKILAGLSTFREAHSSDRLPRPLSEANVHAVNRELGPLPSARRSGQSSRSRLAFTVAVQVGLRIDEILNLPVDVFARMEISPADRMKATILRIEKTKGLVSRDVYFPNWLILELQQYIREERAESLARGRRTWILTAEDEPWQLLLNRPDAPGRNAGKATTADSIENDFNAAMKRLNLVVPQTVMEGTASETTVEVVRHVFHDGRHTYAHWTFSGLLKQGNKVQAAWLLLRNRLGHKHEKTTIDTYLRAFSEIDESAVDLLVEHLARLNADANP